MDNRNNSNEKTPDIEAALQTPKTPNLSLLRKEHVVSFNLPSFRRKYDDADDLPDITPELSTKLADLWDGDEVDEDRPVRTLIAAVRGHLDAINPYVEILKDSQRSWYECWRFLYKIALSLDNASEQSKFDRLYAAPESLHLEEVRARMNLGLADIEWEDAKRQYTDEIDKRSAEIADINTKIKEVTEATEMATLAKYNQKPATKKSQAAASSKATCWTSFLAFFAPKTRVPAQGLQAATGAEDATEFQAMRERLLKELNSELVFKSKNLEEYSERAPTKTTKYRETYNEVKARLLHDKIEYYRCQSKDVMLHCIRLYVLAFRTYYLIYGESPFADGKANSTAEPRIKQIYDEQDKLVLKAKDLFKQMVKGLKVQMSSFYCLQPDRCDFNKYLDNYNNIPKPEDRDAILSGKASDEMIERVFPEFEAPEVAFRLPSPK